MYRGGNIASIIANMDAAGDSPDGCFRERPTFYEGGTTTFGGSSSSSSCPRGGSSNSYPRGPPGGGRSPHMNSTYLADRGSPQINTSSYPTGRTTLVRNLVDPYNNYEESLRAHAAEYPSAERKGKNREDPRRILAREDARIAAHTINTPSTAYNNPRPGTIQTHAGSNNPRPGTIQFGIQGPKSTSGPRSRVYREESPPKAPVAQRRNPGEHRWDTQYMFGHQQEPLDAAERPTVPQRLSISERKNIIEHQRQQAQQGDSSDSDDDDQIGFADIEDGLHQGAHWGWIQETTTYSDQNLPADQNIVEVDDSGHDEEELRYEEYEIDTPLSSDNVESCDEDENIEDHEEHYEDHEEHYEDHEEHYEDHEEIHEDDEKIYEDNEHGYESDENLEGNHDANHHEKTVEEECVEREDYAEQDDEHSDQSEKESEEPQETNVETKKRIHSNKLSIVAASPSDASTPSVSALAREKFGADNHDSSKPPRSLARSAAKDTPTGTSIGDKVRDPLGMRSSNSGSRSNLHGAFDRSEIRSADRSEVRTAASSSEKDYRSIEKDYYRSSEKDWRANEFRNANSRSVVSVLDSSGKNSHATPGYHNIRSSPSIGLDWSNKKSDSWSSSKKSDSWSSGKQDDDFCFRRRSWRDASPAVNRSMNNSAVMQVLNNSSVLNNSGRVNRSEGLTSSAKNVGGNHAASPAHAGLRHASPHVAPNYSTRGGRGHFRNTENLLAVPGGDYPTRRISPIKDRTKPNFPPRRLSPRSLNASFQSNRSATAKDPYATRRSDNPFKNGADVHADATTRKRTDARAEARGLPKDLGSTKSPVRGPSRREVEMRSPNVKSPAVTRNSHLSPGLPRNPTSGPGMTRTTRTAALMKNPDVRRGGCSGGALRSPRTLKSSNAIRSPNTMKSPEKAEMSTISDISCTGSPSARSTKASSTKFDDRSDVRSDCHDVGSDHSFMMESSTNSPADSNALEVLSTRLAPLPKFRPRLQKVKLCVCGSSGQFARERCRLLKEEEKHVKDLQAWQVREDHLQQCLTQFAGQKKKLEERKTNFVKEKRRTEEIKVKLSRMEKEEIPSLEKQFAYMCREVDKTREDIQSTKQEIAMRRASRKMKQEKIQREQRETGLTHELDMVLTELRSVRTETDLSLKKLKSVFNIDDNINTGRKTGRKLDASPMAEGALNDENALNGAMTHPSNDDGTATKDSLGENPVSQNMEHPPPKKLEPLQERSEDNGDIISSITDGYLETAEKFLSSLEVEINETKHKNDVRSKPLEPKRQELQQKRWDLERLENMLRKRKMKKQEIQISVQNTRSELNDLQLTFYGSSPSQGQPHHHQATSEFIRGDNQRLQKEISDLGDLIADQEARILEREQSLAELEHDIAMREASLVEETQECNMENEKETIDDIDDVEEELKIASVELNIEALKEHYKVLEKAVAKKRLKQ